MMVLLEPLKHSNNNLQGNGEIEILFPSYYRVYYCVLAETPSSPSIVRVESYSSTAMVEFEEPDSTGGVPILKYKAEWRPTGAETWQTSNFSARDGNLKDHFFFSIIVVSCM